MRSSSSSLDSSLASSRIGEAWLSCTAATAKPPMATRSFSMWKTARRRSTAQRCRGERPAGRAELLAKKRHTDRLQNLAKLRRFRIGRGGIGGRIIRDFRKMLHFGKIPKKFGQIWRKFSKILAKFANF